MHPIICQIGPFTIYSYGLMLLAGFAAGSTLAGFEAKKQNIGPNIVFNFAFIAFVYGIIGARTLYIVENTGYYIRNPLEIIMLQHGGLSWFGGLALAVISGLIYLRKKNLPIYRMLDLIAPFVALAQGIGRIGCLLNGCCFGKISKFGIYFPAHQERLIPAQAYSSLALIIIFIILRLLQDRPHKQGGIFFAYLLLYSLKRFFIEFWRADNAIILFNLTLFQLISIAVFFLSLIKLLLVKQSK